MSVKMTNMWSESGFECMRDEEVFVKRRVVVSDCNRDSNFVRKHDVISRTRDVCTCDIAFSGGAQKNEFVFEY